MINLLRFYQFYVLSNAAIDICAKSFSKENIFPISLWNLNRRKTLSAVI